MRLPNLPNHTVDNMSGSRRLRLRRPTPFKERPRRYPPLGGAPPAATGGVRKPPHQQATLRKPIRNLGCAAGGGGTSIHMLPMLISSHSSADTVQALERQLWVMSEAQCFPTLRGDSAISCF